MATTALEATRPGLLTTFQDDGRCAADMGVTGSGAADPCSSHLANALVGNPTDVPVLEITGGGVRFTAHGDMVVAVAGAPAPITIIGKATWNSGLDAQRNAGNQSHASERTVVIRQEAMLLRDGEVIEIGVPTSGLRDYLAVRGGLNRRPSPSVRRRATRVPERWSFSLIRTAPCRSWRLTRVFRWNILLRRR